jgi:hypothetical protein
MCSQTNKIQLFLDSEKQGETSRNTGRISVLLFDNTTDQYMVQTYSIVFRFMKYAHAP